MAKLKILFMDVDGTLCPNYGAASKETLELLRQIESMGVRIVLCSGKPVCYLYGLARQLGLRDPSLSGENGVDVQVGNTSPPQRSVCLVWEKESVATLRELSAAVDRHFSDKIWIQADRVAFTVFSYKPENQDELERFIKAFLGEKASEFTIYRFFDCFDVVPKGYSKATGVRYFLEHFKLTRAEAGAIGDGPNDQEMFDAVDFAVSINYESHERVALRVKHVNEGLREILADLRA